MKLSDVIPEILRVVNNPARAGSAFTWVKETLREIGASGRWNWLTHYLVRNFEQNVALPADCHEIFEPIFLDPSAAPLPGAVPFNVEDYSLAIGTAVYDKLGNLVGDDDATGALDATLLVAAGYTAAGADAQGQPFMVYLHDDGTIPLALSFAGVWQAPAVIWKFEQVAHLRLQGFDYTLIRNRPTPQEGVSTTTTIVFSTRWTTGTIWLNYYRNIVMPTGAGDTNDLDLPDEYAYRLLVYGAARHGLLGEDDYDRLKYSEQMYQQALAELREWDGRRGVANMNKRMSTSASPLLVFPAWPSNYSV